MNANNAARFRPWFVEGYGPEDDARAHERLSTFIAWYTEPLYEDRGVTVRRIVPGVR